MESFLKDKKILVTGAGRGIGRALVLSLVRGGAIVYALSKTQDKLNELKVECPGIIPILCDISDWEETISALEKVEVLDGLVNNAGVGILENILDAKKETFDLTFNVNVRGLVQVSNIIAKKMIAEKVKGSIVNISSLASKRAGSLCGIYAASKATVDRLTKIYAVELGPHGIRVNSVNPTVVPTEMSENIYSTSESKAAVIGNIPMRKFADMEDVINAILFMLSDKSAMTSGDTLLVDGGRDAQ